MESSRRLITNIPPQTQSGEEWVRLSLESRTRNRPGRCNGWVRFGVSKVVRRSSGGEVVWRWSSSVVVTCDKEQRERPTMYIGSCETRCKLVVVMEALGMGFKPEVCDKSTRDIRGFVTGFEHQEWEDLSPDLKTGNERIRHRIWRPGIRGFVTGFEDRELEDLSPDLKTRN